MDTTNWIPKWASTRQRRPDSPEASDDAGSADMISTAGMEETNTSSIDSVLCRCRVGKYMVQKKKIR